MRYFRKYPYHPAGDVLRQIVREWAKRDWEYAAIAAASLESYPEMETIKALLIGVQSDNWYVRDNASDSLLRLAKPLAILEMIRQMNDSYGRDMLRYKALSASLIQLEPETEQLVLSTASDPSLKEESPTVLAGWQRLAGTQSPPASKEALPSLQEWEDEK